MKKLILAFSIAAFTLTGYSQGLKPVKIDSLVTVSMPGEFTKKDTLGQQIYSGSGLMGYMMVIRAQNPANNQPLKKENDLNNVFKEYIKKLQGQSSGDIMNARDTTIGKLKAKVFALETNDENGQQVRNFALIYTKDATYTFEYLYPTNRAELIKDENKAYFGSIKISPELERTDQYISTASSGVSGTGKIAIYGGGSLVLLMIGYFIYRKKTETAMS
ncbi:hypothetical protein GCM10023149_46180 [Mucilaginibacter gynuensis]|uniref:LPXTG-motif cell wall-anchored protein n=1 Tax=Mucilaginibacter gynuensis TaxID=1302236 RepID=A0ABP8HBX1_9SPHI